MYIDLVFIFSLPYAFKNYKCFNYFLATDSEKCDFNFLKKVKSYLKQYKKL